MPESRTIQDSEESSDELSSAEDSKSPSPKQTTATSKKRPASPEPALTSTAQQDEDPGAIEKKPIAGLADVANTVAPTEDSPGPSTAVAAEAAAELPPPLSKEEEAKARKVVSKRLPIYASSGRGGLCTANRHACTGRDACAQQGAGSANRGFGGQTRGREGAAKVGPFLHGSR